MVISEIMYHPPDLAYWSNTDDEFVELQNSSTVPVPLYDSARPTNSWRIRGAVDFDFPPNTTLPPGGRLLVVGFDPVSDPLRLDSLRRRAGWDSSIPIFGPLEGRLGNEDDTVRLERPGSGVLTGTVPYITADEVTYESREPWPVEADGGGSSLVRRNLTGLGNDPQNWVALARFASGLDSDEDGLPDAWETAFQLDSLSATGNDGADGDPDSDGFSNRHEFLNGTHPRDPASRFRVSLRAGAGHLDLFLAAPAGERFRIETSPSLTPATWSSLGEITAGSIGATLLNSIPMQPGTHYFRVAKP